MAKVVLDKLEKSYGSNKILRGISATVEDGELVALLGPSGCGKTTTLRCIAGFEIPDSGVISIGDRDITTLLPEQRDIGMVFQNYALFPHMTIFDNVAFGLRMRKRPPAEIRDRVRHIMKVVGLEGFDKRYPRMLSGGQQQRVAMARALCYSPRLLLLDEPTGALDVDSRNGLLDLFDRLHQGGHTLVLITHDPFVAARADRRYRVENGLVREG